MLRQGDGSFLPAAGEVVVSVILILLLSALDAATSRATDLLSVSPALKRGRCSRWKIITRGDVASLQSCLLSWGNQDRPVTRRGMTKPAHQWWRRFEGPGAAFRQRPHGHRRRTSLPTRFSRGGSGRGGSGREADSDSYASRFMMISSMTQGACRNAVAGRSSYRPGCSSTRRSRPSCPRRGTGSCRARTRWLTLGR